MIVSFSVGAKSESVIETLKKSVDNIEFFTYNSIQEMIKEAMLRHISFDRIVFSVKILNDYENDLRELNDFIKNYSDSTEVVMIANKSFGEVDNVFNSIFNSPLYTPVILGKATASSLLSIVRDDIVELKTKYYVLDVDKDKSVVSSAEVKGKSSSKEVEKKGLFSGLMGGKRKNAKTAETASDITNPQDTPSDSTNTESNKSSEFTSGPTSVFTGFSGKSGSELSSVNSELDGVSTFSNGMPSPVGVSSVDANIFSYGEEDIDLSIGDYGSQHSDTGFLDEKEEEELMAMVSPDNEVVESAQVAPDEKSCEVDLSHALQPTVKRKSVVKEIPNIVSTPSNYPNLDLVIAVKGSGATQSIVDEAVKIYTSDEARVLIIDLDYKESGLLSYINTKQFYIEGAFDGISKLRVYTEDGIGIASNGFGAKISSTALNNFLNSPIPYDYDMIFLDCPADCLDVISYSIIKRCHVLVMSGNEKADLYATSRALTDRKKVSLQVERFIMANCEVDFKNDERPEDEEYKEVHSCLFANGNWLNRVD